MCNRCQQPSSCEAHSPSVWLRALRTASTWPPGPSPARWAARPPARPGTTTMKGVRNSFWLVTHATQSPAAQTWTWGISVRGPRYLETTGRHVPSTGDRWSAVTSRRVLQVLRRFLRTCHDATPEPTSKRGFRYVFSICSFQNRVVYSDFKVLTFFLELKG